MDEWMNKRRNKWMNDWASGLMNEWVEEEMINNWKNK